MNVSFGRVVADVLFFTLMILMIIAILSTSQRVSGLEGAAREHKARIEVLETESTDLHRKLARLYFLR